MSNISRRKLHQKPQIGLTTMHKGCEYCWLTQEDVVRYLLSSIRLFSPVAALPIGTLEIIDVDVLAIDYHSPASSSLPTILRSLRGQTSVTVVDENGALIGEISPFTLACCNKAVAAAIAMLSSGDLMAYIDCGGLPEEIVRMVKTRLKQRNLEGMLEEFALVSSSTSSLSFSSSDEESSPSPKTALSRPGKYSRSRSCRPGSLLARKMDRYVWRVKRRIWEMDRQIPSLLELIFRIKLSKIAKGRDLLSLLEIL